MSDEWLNDIHVGDAREVLSQMPDECVDMVVTSPPYWGLRDYGEGTDTVWDADEDCTHIWGNENIKKLDLQAGNDDFKRKWREEASSEKCSTGSFCQKCGAWKGQLGLEPTPELYVKHLTDIFREVKRVLKPSGTVWLNLGDTYSATRWSDTPSTTGISGEESDVVTKKETQIPDKNLVGIPWRVAFALQDDGWYLRNDIIWAKPNPMPESVSDRCTTSHEHIFLLSKNKQYFYDQDSIRESHKSSEDLERRNKLDYKRVINNPRKDLGGRSRDEYYHTKGRNKRDVWNITTKPYSGAHFAVFPPVIPKTCIKAGCPPKVCGECGKPYERITEKGKIVEKRTPEAGMRAKESEKIFGEGTKKANSGLRDGYELRENRTLGWKPACDCDTEETEPGIVLDPFIGAGTTGMVAEELGRKWIGIDISEEYREQALTRIEKGDKYMRKRVRRRREVEKRKKTHVSLNKYIHD